MEILNDFNTSVEKALSEISEDWRSYDGLIVCGTHTPHDLEEMITKIKEARETKLPFLGICAGLQLMAIEYARNVLGIKDATSEEFGQGTFVVKKNRQGMHVGISQVNGEYESFWHNYYVDWHYFYGYNLRIFHQWSEMAYLMRLNDHPFFVGVQFHPEYNSSNFRPHPILKEFLEVCRKQ